VPAGSRRDPDRVSDGHVEGSRRGTIEFSFVLLKGVYKMHFRSCDTPISGDVDCDASNDVVSDAVYVEETSPIVDEESWCLGPQVEDHSVKKYRPTQQVRIEVPRHSAL
jgi:hypothetical protein